MAEELAYVLINPYTLRKSRTGGVISRLLSRVSLELVGARMFAPSREMVREYCRSMIPKKKGAEGKIELAFRNYVKNNYYSDPKTGSRNRVMFLLFKGENAVRELRRVVGHTTRETRGETIRDTYGDYVEYSQGKIKYFEPAVLIAVGSREAEEKIKIWAKYSKKDGGLLENTVSYKKGVVPGKTLVLIKPTSLREPSSHTGSMVDIFSKTGLFIIGARVIRMSIKQAEEFYAPIKKVLLKKLREPLAERIRQVMKSQFTFPLPENIEYEIGERLKYANLEDQFSKIIKFMTGLGPSEARSPEERRRPGKEKCLALVYQGEEAIKKIRIELGTTDPTKALPGTVRKDFGYDVMENSAHASDSRQSASREMKIIKIEEDDIGPIVEDFYA